MYDRAVTITPRVVTGRDARGNDVVSDGETFTARALRDLAKIDEDTSDRDQQARTYRYLIEPRDRATGALIPVTGYDRIVDNDETFEIIGTPEYVRQRRRGRVHHLELDARRVGPSASGVAP